MTGLKAEYEIGFSEGKAEGKTEGAAEERADTVTVLRDMGFSAEQIAEAESRIDALKKNRHSEK